MARASGKSPSPRRLSTLFLFLAWTPLSGCFLQNRGVADAYHRQVTTATLRVAQLEAALVDTEGRIAQLEGTLRHQGREQATGVQGVAEVNAELGRLRGELEVIGFRLAELKEGFDRSAIENERRLLHAELRMSAVERFLGIQPPPLPTDEELGLVEDPPEDTGDPDVSGAETDVASGEPEEEGAHADEEESEGPGDQRAAPEDVDEVLELAISHVESDRPGVARALLEKALTDFAGDAGLAEVQYRIGETWLAERQWSKAIRSFNAVIEGYGKSSWAPWAMLRQAEAFDRWGQRDNAKLFYEEVVRIYPRSDAAKKAREVLSEY